MYDVFYPTRKHETVSELPQPEGQCGAVAHRTYSRAMPYNWYRCDGHGWHALSDAEGRSALDCLLADRVISPAVIDGLLADAKQPDIPDPWELLDRAASVIAALLPGDADGPGFILWSIARAKQLRNAHANH